MTKAELKALSGKKGTCYNGFEGFIIKACLVNDFEALNEYDNSGWLCEEALSEYELEESDVLVAFVSDQGIEVFTLGNGGVDLT